MVLFPRQYGDASYTTYVDTTRVRTGMYMAAIVAMSYNPPIAELVARLKERGKRGKLIVMAALNKLIRICYGVLKNRIPFDPTLNTTPNIA